MIISAVEYDSETGEKIDDIYPIPEYGMLIGYVPPEGRLVIFEAVEVRVSFRADARRWVHYIAIFDERNLFKGDEFRCREFVGAQKTREFHTASRNIAEEFLFFRRDCP